MACGILVPQPGTEPRSPALGAGSVIHWTTREGPQGIFSKHTLVSPCLCLKSCSEEKKTNQNKTLQWLPSTVGIQASLPDEAKKSRLAAPAHCFNLISHLPLCSLSSGYPVLSLVFSNMPVWASGPLHVLFPQPGMPFFWLVISLVPFFGFLHMFPFSERSL